MNRSVGFLCASLVAVFGAVAPLAAQSGTPTLTNEGIAGTLDKYHRAPILTVQPVVSTDLVKLLADAQTGDSDYTQYPIRFDFFVNQKLLSSQIRSPELPGPVGVDVPSTVATVPFNYSVVATLLHPNRQFTTVIYGAAFAQNLINTFNCEVTAEDMVFTSTSPVTTKQAGNASFTYAISASGESSSEGTIDQTFSGSMNISGTNTSGTFTVRNGAPTAVTGRVTFDSSNTMISFTGNSSDNLTKVSCDAASSSSSSSSSASSESSSSEDSSEEALEALIDG